MKEIIKDAYKYWTTESGDKILISDMTTSHLKNSIRFIEQKVSSDKFKLKNVVLNNWVSILKVELRSRNLNQLL